MKFRKSFLYSGHTACIGSVVLLLFLAVAVIFWPMNGIGQQPTIPKLTLIQVQDLILHHVPDSTMSTQIQRRGLTFASNPAIIESLRAKGAGPLTLAAIVESSSKEPKSDQARRPEAAPSSPRVDVTESSTENARTPEKVNLDASVAVGLLLQKTNPIYPPIAKAARVSGTVALQAMISKTGLIESLHVINGPAMLQGAALDAVRTWRYRPFLVEGKPVEVETTINVIFTLGDGPSAQPASGEPAPNSIPSVAAKPADSEPTLATTLQFIQDKLSEQGQVAYLTTLTFLNKPGVTIRQNFRGRDDKVVVDPTTCTLHDSGTMDQTSETSSGGKTVAIDDQHSEMAGSFSFKDVEKVNVVSIENLTRLQLVQNHHPELTATVEPPVFAVELSASKSSFSIHESTTKRGEAPKVEDKTDKEVVFIFRDEEMANRVAKAMLHAVELCRDVNKEPF